MRLWTMTALGLAAGFAVPVLAQDGDSGSGGQAQGSGGSAQQTQAGQSQTDRSQSGQQGQAGQQAQSGQQAQTGAGSGQQMQNGAGGQDGQNQVDVVALEVWDYDPLYAEDNWTAEQLLDADVFGPGGEEIGEVENLVVGTGGVVESLIADVGGFFDIGDTHVRVPWSEVEVTFEDDEEANVWLPVTEETVEDYDVFGGIAGEFQVVDDDDPFTPRGWRVTELIDDYVTLQGGIRYGWVEDVVFDRGGRLQAVVVDALYSDPYGPYAYPFYGYGYDYRPGLPYYELPYGRGQVGALEPFDYGRFGDID